MNVEQADANYRRDLGDGLVLRWSTSADTEALVLLVSSVFRDQADAPLNAALGNLTACINEWYSSADGTGRFRAS